MQTIAIVLVPVLIGVLGQLFLKQGMSEVGKLHLTSIAGMIPQFVKAFMNPWVLAGFAFYFLSSLFWMMVLSRVDLSVAYPLLSIGYVFVLIASWLFFKEPVSTVRWCGVLVIMLGVTLISRS